MGTFTVITAATEEPVTLNEAKEALGVTHEDDDARILKMVKSAREMAEKFTNTFIASQVVERNYHTWPSWTINLKLWPLQSIDSVKYDDTASPSAEQTLVLNDDYQTDIRTIGGLISSIGGWPSTAVKPNPIRVRCTVGYADIDDVPEHVKNAIKAYVVYLYDAEPFMKEVAESLLQGSLYYA